MRCPHKGKRWNGFIARYRCLGYKTLVSVQKRYRVHGCDGWRLAMLSFSAAARRLAARNRFIGWTPQKPEKNPLHVIDNPRLFILPRIPIPNLGSHILAHVRRQLSER